MKLSVKDAKKCNDVIKTYFGLFSVDFDIIPETDMENVITCYKTIEKICLKKLGEDTNG